jgi:hypothetical protein
MDDNGYIPNVAMCMSDKRAGNDTCSRWLIKEGRHFQETFSHPDMFHQRRLQKLATPFLSSLVRTGSLDAMQGA